MRERWCAVMGWVYICVFMAGARRIGICGFQARKTLLCNMVSDFVGKRSYQKIIAKSIGDFSEGVCGGGGNQE